MKNSVFVNNFTKSVKVQYRPGHRKTVFGELLGKCRKTTALLIAPYVRSFGLDIRGSFTGQADCSENDKFDPKYGKGLATQKAVLKYHKSMAKKYEKIYCMLKDALDDISGLEVEHKIKARNIEEDYKRYYLGEE